MTATPGASRGSAIRLETHPGDCWPAIAEASNEATLAHAPEWFTVIERAYGHQPLYLTGKDREGHRGVLPAFIVRRPLAGTVVTSMPFLDSGGPCSSSSRLAQSLVEHLIAQANRLRADAVDLRCTLRLDVGAEPMEHKVNMVLSLPSRPDTLWPHLDSSVRNQIRKAERSGLSIEAGGRERLTDFYAIFAARMRDLGSPVHALKFFSAMFDAFGRRARVFLVRKDRAPIGGLIALTFKDTVVVPWASCLKEFFALCPNMLLYWETIRLACAEGARRFDFGRSTRGSGTHRFKRQWGAADVPLFWYTIPLRSSRPRVLPAVGGGAGFLGELWQRLPLAVTRQVGPHVRKYLIQ